MTGSRNHSRPVLGAVGSALLPSRRDIFRHAPGAVMLLGYPSLAYARTEVTADLFTQIPRLEISNAIQAILTRGWRMHGVGAARYIFDARVDRAWVTRYPASSAMAANGRGFRLDAVGGDVRQYGASGDGKTDDTAAINEALSRGGTVTLAGPATYTVTDRLLLPIAQTRLVFENAVTLRTRAWRYKGGQSPFGNAIHITGDDCEVIGSGPTSVLQSVGSDANGIGFLHCAGGRVARLVLKGGKRDLAAITDDTFQSGISIVNDRASNAGGRHSGTIVEDCSIVDWMQYGINIYGDLAADIVIRRNEIARAGKADDRESVGGGLALTRGVGPVLLETNTISDNKGYGILVSSAGVEIHDILIMRNQIVGNGLDGIRCSEEKHFGAVSNVGQRQVTISDNRIEGNGAMGIRVGTYDGVGSIRQFAVLRNRIVRNSGSGILLQANAAPGQDVNARVEGNQFVSNNEYGMAIGVNHVGLQYKGNVFAGNRRGPSVDHRGGGAPRQLAER